MVKHVFEPFANPNKKGQSKVFDSSCYLHDSDITFFFYAPLFLSPHLFAAFTVDDITAAEKTLLDKDIKK